MTLIRALFESAVLDREAAFSTLLLAEAAKKELRANSVPFFIRVLVLTMQVSIRVGLGLGLGLG